MTTYLYLDGIPQKGAGGPGVIKNKKDISFLYNGRTKRLFERCYKNKVNYNKELNDILWMDSKNILKAIENIKLSSINFSIDEEIAKFINLKKAKSFHLHSTRDFFKIKNFLNLNNKNVPIIMTPHGPVPAYIGMPIYVSPFLNEEQTKNYCDTYKYFDETAFKYSDVIVVSSKEALNAYYELWDDFEDIIKNKDVRTLPIGCEKIITSLSREEFRNSHKIPMDATVICYTGRHDSEKGYDNLIDAGLKILNENKNTYIVISGAQTLIKPPKHERWIELGYLDNLGDLLYAADVFVLGNKYTYYDLILLEVLSTGLPVIASYTGGNISVSKLTNGILTYSYGADNLYEKINEFLNLPMSKIQELRMSNLECYNKYFTLEKFANRYVKTLDEIEKDYWKK